MTERPKFDCAPGLKLAAHEQLMTVQLRHIEKRFERMELLMERMEKRLWITIYGVVAVILSEALQSILAVTPG